MYSQFTSKILIISSFKAKWYNFFLCFEAKPHYLVWSKKLVILYFINKTLFNKYKALINKICNNNSIKCKWEGFYYLYGLFSITIIDLLSFLIELPKFIGINNQAIDIIQNKQIFYSLIYSLGLMELKTLKIYIKIWLINLFCFFSHKLEIWSYFFL